MSVVDLGGRVETWTSAPVRPRHVHLLNLEPISGDLPEWATFEEVDCCQLPRHLAQRTFDLAFSNSVIEHVGGHERRLRFAEAIRSLAPAFFIQTPYRYFPIEPHWVAPAMQFLPVTARAALAERWPLSHSPAGSRENALESVLWTELVDRTQMRHYFPDAEIFFERVCGLPKSIMVVRG